jgi:hypothetical protein
MITKQTLTELGFKINSVDKLATKILSEGDNSVAIQIDEDVNVYILTFGARVKTRVKTEQDLKALINVIDNTPAELPF